MGFKLEFGWCDFMKLTYEQQVIFHEVDPVSLSQRSVELDAGAGGDNALLVFFSLPAVRTLQHGEAAATGLHAHTDTQRQALEDTPNLESPRFCNNKI